MGYCIEVGCVQFERTGIDESFVGTQVGVIVYNWVVTADVGGKG